MAEALIFSLKQVTRSFAPVVRESWEEWLFEVSGEVCSSHWAARYPENTAGLPGDPAHPFQDVDHEHKVTASWPVV